MVTLKILIVDDENIIREGLAKKILRLFPAADIVGKAPNARTALQMIEAHCPNIVITDIRMPETDGLQLIRKARLFKADIKFVIISGYQDFEYARTAIGLGVEDYLLKPIENEELQQIILKLEKKIEQELYHDKYVDTLRQTATISREYLKNKYLTDMMEYGMEADINHIVGNLRAIDIDFRLSLFTVLNIAVSSYDHIPDFSRKEDIPILKYAIRNIAAEITANAGRAVVFENIKDDRQTIVIINQDRSPHSDSTPEILRLCSNLLDALSRYLNLSAVIGISQKQEGITSLPTLYYQAYTAVMQKLLVGCNKVICFNDIPASNGITYLLEEERKSFLHNYIKEGDMKKSAEAVEEIFLTMEKNNLSYNNVKAIYIELFILFMKSLKEAGGSWDKIFKEDIISETCLTRYTSLHALCTWIKECLAAICSYIHELRKNESKKVIDEVKDYIQNYYYTGITLNTLARKYYINPSYLSQLLKSGLGENFIDYITRIRIEKARELLKNSDLKAYKIGEMVGYDNPRYFSELFQKYTGSTPMEFRKNAGKTGS